LEIYNKTEEIRLEPDNMEDQVLTHSWVCQRTAEDENRYVFRTPFDFTGCTAADLIDLAAKRSSNRGGQEINYSELATLDLYVLASEYIVRHSRISEFRKRYAIPNRDGSKENRKTRRVDEARTDELFETPFDVGAWYTEIESVRSLYEDLGHMAAYSKRVDLRVENNPLTANGGRINNWERGGSKQLEFLVSKGLTPRHRLLDLGCGTLRAGRQFIPYLERGNYTGIDISQRAIEYGRGLVKRERLLKKDPHLVVNQSLDLKFDDLQGNTFDYIIARSVFTHLPSEFIEECFEYLHRIMDEDARFYFTYFCSESYLQTSRGGYRYPFSYFEELAQRHGFHAVECSQDWPQGTQSVGEVRAI